MVLRKWGDVIAKKATTIAIVNQKGGTAKTTTCENLGIGLAMEGKKVLLVDVDPQGSLTISMGWQDTDSIPTTLSTLMQKAMSDQPIKPGEGILHHAEGVDLIPANIELAGMEVALVNSMNREKMLKQVLDSAKREYDYILLDCTPSLGMLTVNALAAADTTLIPMQAQYLSAKGLEQLLQTIGKVRRQINPKLKIEGILLTMTDSRTTYGKQIDNLIRQGYGRKIHVFEQTIPHSVRAAEIMNEWYARDTSKKIRSAFQAKNLAGKHTSSSVPYGYLKSEQDKNQWVIDPVAAPIVQRIYRMTMEGKGPYQIAAILSAEHIEIPAYYHQKLGIGLWQTREIRDPYKWGSSTIVHILTNPCYLGHTCNFKTRKHFKDKKSHYVDQDQWTIISKSIQGHQRQLTTEERTSLKASIDNRYQERAVANGSLMMCEVQGAKEDFIRRWNTIFKEYPDVFEDSDCRKIIHDLTEDAVQYLLKIKEKTI